MSANRERPIRILQAVGQMDRAGIETWLMHLLRHIDRDRFQMDFLTRTCQKAAYDDEIEALGSRIIPCVSRVFAHRYSRRRLRQILRDFGPYDVVHSHPQHYSGWVLRIAAEAGVPIRIAHSHSDTQGLYRQKSLLHRAYYSTMARWVSRYATDGLAASEKVAVALFGANWQSDPRWRILHCGVDFSPFGATVDRAGVRAEFGIPDDAFVVGHVGRLAEAKNHRFLIDVVAELARREPRTWLMLVGEGPLETDIRRRAANRGLSHRVVFTGARPDVPRLMRGAMDAFVFPSAREGLGLALIEAQAAGLPCVFSDVVPREAEIVESLLRRLPLSAPASTWAATVAQARSGISVASRRAALSEAMRSSFDIRRHVETLTALYTRTAVRRAAA
ncbi:MAG: glycosyltransferase [Pirellulales bacterium]|nr:glycosyltransferase [Pirellulales bacterium]